MRSPERIPVILDRLRAVWERFPDYRLAQLIVVEQADPFYREDEDLIAAIEQWAQTAQNGGDNA